MATNGPHLRVDKFERKSNSPDIRFSLTCLESYKINQQLKTEKEKIELYIF